MLLILSKSYFQLKMFTSVPSMFGNFTYIWSNVKPNHNHAITRRLYLYKIKINYSELAKIGVYCLLIMIFVIFFIYSLYISNIVVKENPIYNINYNYISILKMTSITLVFPLLLYFFTFNIKNYNILITILKYCFFLFRNIDPLIFFKLILVHGNSYNKLKKISNSILILYIYRIVVTISLLIVLYCNSHGILYTMAFIIMKNFSWFFFLTINTYAILSLEKFTFKRILLVVLVTGFIFTVINPILSSIMYELFLPLVLPLFNLSEYVVYMFPANSSSSSHNLSGSNNSGSPNPGSNNNNPPLSCDNSDNERSDGSSEKKPYFPWLELKKWHRDEWFSPKVIGDVTLSLFKNDVSARFVDLAKGGSSDTQKLLDINLLKSDEYKYEITINKDDNRPSIDDNTISYKEPDGKKQTYVRVGESVFETLAAFTRKHTGMLRLISEYKFDMKEFSTIRARHNPYNESTRFNYMIQETLSNDKKSREWETNALWNSILNSLFKVEDGFFVGTESHSGVGICDFLVKYNDVYHGTPREGDVTNADRIKSIFHTIVENKSATGKSWNDQYEQANNYAYNNKGDFQSVFVVCCRGSKVAFFSHEEDFHKTRYLGLKGNSDGLLGLVLDHEGIKVLPQINNRQCQSYPYDLTDDRDREHIMIIFKWMSMLKYPPAVEVNEGKIILVTDDDLIREKSKISIGEYKSGVDWKELYMHADGRLTK